MSVTRTIVWADLESLAVRVEELEADLKSAKRELAFVKTERDGLAVVVQQREDQLHEARAALRALRDGGKPGE
jgi:chromosome segregation ATPase